VEQVWGKSLVYKGSAITPYYHSTCGGGTSSAEGILPQTPPYLQAVDCQFCRQSPFWKVKQALIPQKVFARLCFSGIPVVEQLNQQDRPLLVRFPNGKQLSGYRFWLAIGQNFGWDKVPGMRYKLDGISGQQVSIESNGAGHGLGLCQWGAAELAKQGQSWRQILRYYFPQTQVR
jgi:stage II sporulation protein D